MGVQSLLQFRSNQEDEEPKPRAKPSIEGEEEEPRKGDVELGEVISFRCDYCEAKIRARTTQSRVRCPRCTKSQDVPAQ
jgi:hypothetical protein